MFVKYKDICNDPANNGKTPAEMREIFFRELNDEDPTRTRVLMGEEIIPFDKYADFIEAAQYMLLMHASRMTLLIKLVNKSYNVRYQERIDKKKKAKERNAGTLSIENDLF